jgi:hypothetical protein
MPKSMLKFILKSLGIVLLAVVVNLAVQTISGLYLCPLLTKMGLFGILSFLGITIIGLNALVAALVIGILGGRFIGTWRWNGCVLACAYYLFFFALGADLIKGPLLAFETGGGR